MSSDTLEQLSVRGADVASGKFADQYTAAKKAAPGRAMTEIAWSMPPDATPTCLSQVHVNAATSGCGTPPAPYAPRTAMDTATTSAELLLRPLP